MINRYLFFAIAMVGMFSCQQVIDINLNESAPQFVFEAALEEGTHDFKVRATKTGNYFSTEAPTPIKDAIIKLSTEQGGELLLNNENNGYYTLNQYAALNNTDYKLTIQTEGKTFTASSYLPKSVVLDSVSVEKIRLILLVARTRIVYLPCFVILRILKMKSIIIKLKVWSMVSHLPKVIKY